MRINYLFFALLSAVMLLSCEKENDDVMADVVSESSISGFAQKGPFIKGSNITAYPLNDKLLPTGECFTSSVKDNLGSFSVSAETSAPYIELKAEGYCFNENGGYITDAPIYLNALIESSQKKANVNVLTTITSGRIKKLISDGKTFLEAKKQAEREFLDVFSAKFSFNHDEVTIGFEEMNILEDGKSNAFLLALSCCINTTFNNGEFGAGQKAISDISLQFESDGSVSDKLLQRFEVFNEEFSSSGIIGIVENLIEFYEDNGISDFKIPPFYSMLNKEFYEGFHVISSQDIVTSDGYDTDAQGGTKGYYVISYDGFITESDVDWITAETKEICNNLYRLNVKISPNNELSGRTGNLYIKSKNGETLYTSITKQRGIGQRIYIRQVGITERVITLNDENKINVNGVDYNLLFDNSLNMYYVDVPNADEGYGISNMPEFLVSGKNGDVLCATFTYKPVIDEYIYDDEITDGGDIIIGGDDQISLKEYSASLLPWKMKIPYYVALKSYAGMEVPNPAFVKFEEPACALLTLQFKEEDYSDLNYITELDVEINSDGFLSGEVTTCMYPDNDMYDPSYVVPQTEYKNKSNKLTVYNTNEDNIISFLVYPQTISELKISFSYNDKAYSMNMNSSIDIRRGSNVKVNVVVLKDGIQTNIE